MSNIDAVNALLTSIHFDRFAEIEALHAPYAVFHSFRGPTLRDSVSIADWHREFLKDYADCNYTELEYIESGETVAVRATLEAKGFDWRPFTQRVVEVFEFEAGRIAARRLYAMQPDIELDKPAQQAFDNAFGFRGGSAGTTRQAVEQWLAALDQGDADALRTLMHESNVVVDGVYGVASGFEKVLALFSGRPRPVFGASRVTSSYYGDHTALVEAAIEPSRPREATWVRLVDGKVAAVEVYWMMREIGVTTEPKARHPKQVILPI